jgi:nicotinamidase-related amidase
MADLARQAIGLGQYPALILVDMSLGFTQPESPLGGYFDSEVEASQILVAAFRDRTLPVVYTTVVYDRDEDASVFRARLPSLNILKRGSAWVEIDPRLAPRDDDLVVEKHFPSAFMGTDLAERLRAMGVDSCVVVGLTTSGCVRATAVDALSHNFPTVVVREGVGDRNLEAHAANLHDMHAKYVDVMSLDETLAMLDRLERVA